MRFRVRAAVAYVASAFLAGVLAPAGSSLWLRAAVNFAFVTLAWTGGAFDR